MKQIDAHIIISISLVILRLSGSRLSQISKQSHKEIGNVTRIILLLTAGGPVSSAILEQGKTQWIVALHGWLKHQHIWFTPDNSQNTSDQHNRLHFRLLLRITDTTVSGVNNGDTSLFPYTSVYFCIRIISAMFAPTSIIKNNYLLAKLNHKLWLFTYNVKFNQESQDWKFYIVKKFVAFKYKVLWSVV